MKLADLEKQRQTSGWWQWRGRQGTACESMARRQEIVSRVEDQAWEERQKVSEMPRHSHERACVMPTDVFVLCLA